MILKCLISKKIPKRRHPSIDLRQKIVGRKASAFDNAGRSWAQGSYGPAFFRMTEAVGQAVGGSVANLEITRT